MAASKGHSQAVDTILGHGKIADYELSVDAEDNDRNTPLHLAAMNGDAPTVKRLIDFPSDTELRNRNDLTPAQLAAARGHDAILKVLHEASADIDPEYGELPPAYLAAFHGHANTIRTLHELGADVVKAHSLATTPLHIAVLRNHPDAVKTLLELGANPLQKNNSGIRPVDWAKKNTEIRQLLQAAIRQRRYPTFIRGMDGVIKVAQSVMNWIRKKT